MKRNYLAIPLVAGFLLTACNSNNANLQNSLQLKLPLTEGEELQYLKIFIYPVTPEHVTEEEMQEEVEEIPPFVCGSENGPSCAELPREGDSYIVSLPKPKAEKVSLYLQAVTRRENGKNGFYIFGDASTDECAVAAGGCRAAGKRYSAREIHPVFKLTADGLSDSLSSAGPAGFKSGKNLKAGKSAALNFAFMLNNEPDGDLISLVFPLTGGAAYSWQGEIPAGPANGWEEVPLIHVSISEDGQKMAIWNNGQPCNELLLYAGNSFTGREADSKCALSIEKFAEFNGCIGDDCATDAATDDDGNTDANSDIDVCTDVAYLNGLLLSNDAFNNGTYQEIINSLSSQFDTEDADFKAFKNFRGLPAWNISGNLINSVSGAKCPYNISVKAEKGETYSLLSPAVTSSAEPQGVIKQLLVHKGDLYAVNEQITTQGKNMSSVTLSVIKVTHEEENGYKQEVIYNKTIQVGNKELDMKDSQHYYIFHKLLVLDGKLALGYGNCQAEVENTINNPHRCSYITLEGQDAGTRINKDIVAQYNAENILGNFKTLDEVTDIQLYYGDTEMGPNGLKIAIMAPGADGSSLTLQNYCQGTSINASSNLIETFLLGENILAVANEDGIDIKHLDPEENDRQHTCHLEDGLQNLVYQAAIEAADADYSTYFNQVAFAPDGTLYAIDFANNMIYRSAISLENMNNLEEEMVNGTTAPLIMEPFINFISPAAIAVADEALYVVTSGQAGNYLYSIDIKSGIISDTNLNLGGEVREPSLVYPTALLYDNEKLFIADTFLGQIRVLDMSADGVTEERPIGIWNGHGLLDAPQEEVESASSYNLGKIVDLKAADGGFYLATHFSKQKNIGSGSGGICNHLLLPQAAIYQYEMVSDRLMRLAGKSTASSVYGCTDGNLVLLNETLTFNRDVAEEDVRFDRVNCSSGTCSVTNSPANYREYIYATMALLGDELFWDIPTYNGSDLTYGGPYMAMSGTKYKPKNTNNSSNLPPLGHNVSISDGSKEVLFAALQHSEEGAYLMCANFSAAMEEDEGFKLFDWCNNYLDTADENNIIWNINCDGNTQKFGHNITGIATNGQDVLYISYFDNNNGQKKGALMKIAFKDENGSKIPLCDPTAEKRPAVQILNEIAMPATVQSLTYIPAADARPEQLCYSVIDSEAGNSVECVVISD